MSGTKSIREGAPVAAAKEEAEIPRMVRVLLRLDITRGSVSALRTILGQLVRAQRELSECLAVDVAVSGEHMVVVVDYQSSEGALAGLRILLNRPAARRLRDRTVLTSLEVVGPVTDPVARTVVAAGGEVLMRIEGFSDAPVLHA